MRISSLLVMTISLAWPGAAFSEEEEEAAFETVKLDNPPGAIGTVHCIVTPDKDYQNGFIAGKADQTFLKVPGIVKLYFTQRKATLNLLWIWELDGPQDIRISCTDLYAEPYHMSFTWDGEQGVYQGYVNGIPMSVGGVNIDPFEVSETVNEAHLPDNPVKVSEVKALDKFLSDEEARALVPEELLDKHPEMIGATPDAEIIDYESRRGELLYENPLKSEEDVEGWVMEGPGVVEFEDDCMYMYSPNEEFNHVFWCPEDFPADTIIEWEFQARELAGLSIIFFCAKGENGEDIFDPQLAERDGTFAHYNRGDIVSYHTSYYANMPGAIGRATSNMRKNNHFMLVENGPPAVMPNDRDWHKLHVIRDGNHIQLLSDGKLIIDFVDDNEERYGPPHGGGKIGFRQMTWTDGNYRNFKVHSLNRK